MLNLQTLFQGSPTEPGNLNNLLALFAAKFDKFQASVMQEFGPNGFYILIAFACFIALIAFIYIKSVLQTFRVTGGGSYDAGLFYQAVSGSGSGSPDPDTDEPEDVLEDNRPRLTVPDAAMESLQNTSSSSVSDADVHENMKSAATKSFSAKRRAALLEKDQELSRDLVMSSVTTDDILRLKEQLRQQADKNQEIRLDWQKNTNEEPDVLDKKTTLFFQQPKESLEELISLIINMLGRDVTPEKTAQAVYQRNQGKNSEEDIIQTITTVRDFIALCNTGKFDSLPQRSELPAEKDALYEWANGDNSSCLSLLENLIKQQIDKADTQNGILKEMSYAQAASYACMFGTIAAQNNPELAQNSFELALELAPQNINAWSRCGDIYWQQGDYEKAVYAYQTVTENGDEVLYAPQIANANHKLSEYYMQFGKKESADKLERNSRKYYDDFGITKDLTPRETENLNFIVQNHQMNLPVAIGKLLQSRQQQYA